MVEITIAAIEKPFPFPLRLLALAKPTPPKIQPNNGTRKEHINPAMAMPLLFFGFSIIFISGILPIHTPQCVQSTALSSISFPQFEQNIINPPTFVIPLLYFQYIGMSSIFCQYIGSIFTLSNILAKILL